MNERTAHPRTLDVKKHVRALRERPHRMFALSLLLSLAFSCTAFFFIGLSDLVILAIMIAIMPPGLYDYYEKRRVRTIEAEFPSLLQDIAASRKTGIPLNEAVGMAAQGDYGVLTGGIKWMEAMMSWEASFEEALIRFVKKYPTPVIRRTVSIILEAFRAGGEISEILETVAEDAMELKMLSEKRSAETSPYVVICYIAYFVFVVVIIVLSTQFLPMMEESAAAAAGGAAASGFGMASPDVALYRTLFFHALVLQGFFSGLVTGKIGEGRMIAGLKHSLVLVAISFVICAVVL